MVRLLWIMFGGAIGTALRVGVTEAATRLWGPGFPWGTIIANITGSFAIGFFGTAVGPENKWMTSATTRQFLMVGICGGYTTFSSFSLQTLDHLEKGEPLKATANVILSVTLCLAAVWLGHLIAIKVNE